MHPRLASREKKVSPELDPSLEEPGVGSWLFLAYNIVRQFAIALLVAFTFTESKET